MTKEEAIQKAIEKAQNECDLLYYPVVCEGTVIDGVEEMSSALDNYQKKLAEHTDMWIICEMAKRWLEYLRDKKESKKTAERPQWIPVSERLPPYSEKIVLATVVRRDKTWNNDPYHRLVTYSQGKWYPVPQSINLVPCRMATIEQSDGGQAEVIAWMPLPETYREEAMG